jgi:hypothetical protein
MQQLRVGRFLKHYGLLLLWALTVVAMKLDDIRDPFDPANPVGHRLPRHNGEYELFGGVFYATAMLGILYAILRPRSYCRSWKRSLSALVIVLPWFGTNMLAAMFGVGAGIVGWHLAWVLAIVVVLTAATIISTRAAANHRLLHPPIVVPTAKVVGR